MGAEAIIDKIRKNSEEEIAALTKQGSDRAEAAAAKIRAEAEAEANFLLQSAMKTVDEMERREMLMAGVETRKNSLASRRAVIDEAFSMAHDRLNELPEDRWEAFITRLILEAAETGEEVLEVPAADREKYESGSMSFLQRLNDALKNSGRKGNLTLTDAPADMKGGFKLCGKIYDVNGSYEMLLELAREQSEREIYNILYPKEQ